MVFPLPLVAPDAPVCVTVHAKVVPATSAVSAIDVAVPEQIVCEDGVAVATGLGLTVMVTFMGVPVHPVGAVGVIV